MTSVSLNLLGPTVQHQSQLFISPNNHDSTLSCCSLFRVLDQSHTKDIRDLRHGDQEDGKLEFHGGSSDNQQVSNASSVHPKAVMADEISSTYNHHNISFYKIENQENRRGTYEYEKWLSSNVRLTRKMMSPPSTDSDLATKKTLNIIRVCADCNTTSTPLWRSGPNGPKSLCNACGIRQRKARRAMAEAAAANGFSPSSSMDAKTRLVHHHKEKKCRTNHFARFKNKSKAATSAAAAVRGTLSEEQKVRIDLKDFAKSLRDGSALKQVFPMDEVTHAALLLMDLSTGFLYF